MRCSRARCLTDGKYLRDWKLPGTPCGLVVSRDQHLWLAHGQFGEAHYIAVSATDELYVADTLNWRVQKFVRKAR